MWCLHSQKDNYTENKCWKNHSRPQRSNKIGETKVNVQRDKERHIHQLVINMLDKITLKDHPLNSIEKKWIN